METVSESINSGSKTSINSQNTVLTKRSYIIFALFSIFHLVISIQNLDNIVWVVNWESGILIAKGVPMYEQSGSVYNSVGHGHSLPPDHFPLYFYLLALIVTLFGPYAVIARVITWLFVISIPTILYYTIKPKTEFEWLTVQFLYFLDPQLITTNYYGKFDQITMFFILLGLYFGIRNRDILAGFFLGLGIMVKFFPVFAFLVLGATYLNQSKIKRFVKLSVSGIITSGIIFIYHGLKWGDSFYNIIIFQINRLTPSLSLWYYLLPQDIEGTTLLIPQLIFMALIGLAILFAPKIQNEYFPYIANSVLIAGYLLISRQYYATYIYFATAPLIPILIIWLRDGKYKPITYILSAYFIFSLGTIFCYNSCYPQFSPFTIFSWIGVYLVFIGTFMFLPVYYLYFHYLKLQT